MTKHPITMPPELVRDWAQKAQLLSGDDPVSFAELLCNKAARWGADQELEVEVWKIVLLELKQFFMILKKKNGLLKQELLFFLFLY